MRTMTDTQIAQAQVCHQDQHFFVVHRLDSGKRIFVCARVECSATKPFTMPSRVDVINVGQAAEEVARNLEEYV